MSNKIIVYREEKNTLPELAFIKDIPNQIKIRDISGYELTKQFGMLWLPIIVAMGIKGEIDSFTKNDIKEMILMRFKNLSLNEIAYAFRLERYGLLGDKINHFQLFDSSYVSSILEKYVNWKKEIRIEHKISPELPAHEEISKDEAKKLVNQAIKTAWEYAQKTFGLKDGYVFIYEELMDSGFLNKEIEFKKKIHKEAIEVLSIELKEKSVTDNRTERKKYLDTLANLKTPKFPAVIVKCKELSILSFFREVKKDEQKLKEFKTKYGLE